MARTTPAAAYGFLSYTTPTGRYVQGIAVGSPEWFTWLEQAESFRFENNVGTFTARKEARARGGMYWTAYRRAGGKLHRVYLGASDDLTPERLQQAARDLVASCQKFQE